jgi:hypothetical protein
MALARPWILALLFVSGCGGKTAITCNRQADCDTKAFADCSGGFTTWQAHSQTAPDGKTQVDFVYQCHDFGYWSQEAWRRSVRAVGTALNVFPQDEAAELSDDEQPTASNEMGALPRYVQLL